MVTNHHRSEIPKHGMKEKSNGPHWDLKIKAQLVEHLFFSYYYYLFFIYLCKSPDTQGLKATSRCGLQLFFSRGCCHLLLGLKQDYPFHSPYGCITAWVSSVRSLAGRAESTTSPKRVLGVLGSDPNEYRLIFSLFPW